VEKLFEVVIAPSTIKKRAQRAKTKMGTNVPNPSTLCNDEGNGGNWQNWRDESGKFTKGHPGIGGRPPKFKVVRPELDMCKFQITIKAVEHYTDEDIQELFEPDESLEGQIARFWKDTLSREAITLEDVRVKAERV